MKKNIEIVNECYCEGWVEAFVRAVFAHADIDLEAEELVITEMDGDRIHLWCEVFDETIPPDVDGGEPGDYVEKNYTIRYFDEDERWCNFVISYILFEFDEQWSGEQIDEGVYKIVNSRGKAKCTRLDY